MKKVGNFVILTLFFGGLLIARTGKGNISVENKNTQVKNQYQLINGHSDNDQLDRKRSHKRRRKIRKPNKGLR